MTKAVKRIRTYEKHFDLSSQQTLYLVYKYFGIVYSINSKQLIELMDYKILDENGDFIENLDTITKLSSKKMVIVKPLFYNKMSAKVYEYMKARLCFKNPYDGLTIATNPNKISLDKESKLTKYKEDTLKKLSREKGFYEAYNLFLCLNPSATLEDNVKWINFFKVGYSGVNLRKRTTVNTNKFIKIIRANDTGVFMYGLYLFIRSGIKGSETFIGSQKTFLSEWEDWYSEAENLIDKAEKVEELFKHRGKQGSTHKGGVAL